MIGGLQYTPDPKVFQNNLYATKGIDNETHSNWFAEKMCEIMSKTTKWCDVMSLAAPDGYFREQFKIALKNIAKNAEGKDEPIIVRLMFGNIIGLPINCERLMRKLTEELPEDSNVKVWVGAWRYGATWNHTKLIAVDGKVCLVSFDHSIILHLSVTYNQHSIFMWEDTTCGVIFI